MYVNVYTYKPDLPDINWEEYKEFMSKLIDAAVMGYPIQHQKHRCQYCEKESFVRVQNTKIAELALIDAFILIQKDLFKHIEEYNYSKNLLQNIFGPHIKI